MSIEPPNKENPMQKPRIEKVVVNIAVGKPGEPLEKAVKVLQQLTAKKPCRIKAKNTIREFGIRRGEQIACLVTLRGQKAAEFLKKAFYTLSNKISESNFDQYGNFSFGIREHIEIPETKYMPELGIFGMDICVTMGRLGYRVVRRRLRSGKIGLSQRLTREEAVQFIKETFGVEIGKVD